MSDFALMAILPLRTVEVARLPAQRARDGGAGRPVPVPAGARGRPAPAARRSSWLGGLLVLLLCSGIANDVDWTRRVGHVAIMAGLIWAGGTGRLSLRSVGRRAGDRPDRRHRSGAASASAVTLPGSPHRLPRRPQRRRLLHRRPGRRSRSSSADDRAQGAARRSRCRSSPASSSATPAPACWPAPSPCCGSWLGRRLGRWPARSLAVGLVWVVDNIPESLITFGPFSDRSGSDRLRERIIAQEHVQLADIAVVRQRPRHRQGRDPRPRVLLPQQLSRHAAGGRLGGAAARPGRPGLRLPASLAAQSHAGDIKAAAAQAAIIGTAVMAITLGEVLLDTPDGRRGGVRPRSCPRCSDAPRAHPMAERIHLAANNPDLGGGELMLLRHAEALRAAGPPGHRRGSGLAERGAGRGRGRPAPTWSRSAPTGVGDYLHAPPRLGPQRAAGRAVVPRPGPGVRDVRAPRRIVHLHQDPRGRARSASRRRSPGGARWPRSCPPSSRPAACRAASAANWTQRPAAPGPRPPRDPRTVGYLGRLSTDKGLDVLARRARHASRRRRLLLAGDTRYVDADSVAPRRRGRRRASATGRHVSATSRPRSSSAASPSSCSPASGPSRSGSSSPRPWRPASPSSSPTPARCPRSPAPTTRGSPARATPTTSRGWSPTRWPPRPTRPRS